MKSRKATTARSDSATLDYEEPEDAKLRALLGLRPIVYKGDDRTADTRPCPSWCWIGQSDGNYEHEVECAHPMSATHSMEAAPTIVASQYAGNILAGESPRLVEPATLEPGLEQVGQGEPLIRIALRHGYGEQHSYEDERLLLSLDDARELVTVLTYLVETADKG